MRIDMPHPIPPLQYSSCGTPPLLDEYPALYAHVDHGDFEIRALSGLTKTPIIQEVKPAGADKRTEGPESAAHALADTEDDFFEEGEEDIDNTPLTELPLSEYVPRATILLLVQALILLPMVLPRGRERARRAVQLVLVGWAVHVTAAFIHAWQDVTPHTQLSLGLRLPDVPNLLSVTPALAQLAIAALGGAIAGVVFALGLNALVIAHTAHSLAHRREPDATLLLASLQSSHKRVTRAVLDVITAIMIVPASLAAQRWSGAAFPRARPTLDATSEQLVKTAVLGAVALHLASLARAAISWRRASARAADTPNGLFDTARGRVGSALYQVFRDGCGPRTTLATPHAWPSRRSVSDAAVCS